MEQLKKILRQALGNGTQRIRLQEGSAVELMTAKGPTPIDPQIAPASVSSAWVEQLITALLSQDKQAMILLSQGKPTRGALSIPNVGRISLIAQPQRPMTLSLYLPPASGSMFENDWNQMAPPAMNITSPLPIKLAAMPAAQVEHVAAAAMSQTPPPPPVFQAPQAPQVIEEPNMPEVPVGIASAPAHAEPFAPLPLVPPPVDASLMFAPPSMPKNNSTTLVAPPAPMAAPLAAPVAAPVSSAVAPPIQTMAPKLAVVDETQQSVSYDVDAGAKGSLSYGENPVDAILTDMVNRRSSDLHLTTGQPVCMRVDGEITRLGEDILTPDRMAQLLNPLFPVRNRQEFIEGNDTDFAYELSGVGRFRVNVFRDRNGVGSVMRHIPSKILTAEQLNLPPVVTKFCQLSKGLVVVTGPTGSGKSTTLAAMVDLINKTRHDHILTIEDPIEFVHPQQKCLLNQRELHRHTKSFSRALRAALREDPDIVLIGEMRDLETVAIAIETAETGHLVFGTLHTTTAVSTVDRIIDQFPTTQQEQIRMMLASSLKGVVAQTLLKKKGGGRVAALEILVLNDAVSAMIREGKNHMIPGHMQTQKGDGNQLLNDALAKLVKDNVVEAEEALRKAVDKNGLIDIFRRMAIKIPAGFGPPEKPAAPGTKQSA